MILKFIQAESKQPVLIMASAIASVVNTDPGEAAIRTTDARTFYVLGTVEQILAEVIGQTGLSHVAIAPIG